MIHVCYSNRLEELSAALAAALPPVGDPFDVPWLVVPGRTMKAFVDLDLARRRGIAGNLDTLSLMGAFARLGAEATEPTVLIERRHLTAELLAVLAARPAGETTTGALAPIDAYLRGAGDAPDAIERRRVEVARALATLFDDWVGTRPEWLAAWRAGRTAAGSAATRATAGAAAGGAAADGGVDPRLEGAARALFVALFGPDGRFARRSAIEGRRYLALDALFEEGLDRTWRPPRAIHVFGVSTMPRGLQLALGRLGERTALSLYCVNPCREYWEDLDAGARRRDRKGAARDDARFPKRAARRQLGLGAPDDPFELDAPESEAEHENPFLRAWARPGREMIRLLNHLCACDFDARFVEPTAAAGSMGDGAGGGGADANAAPSLLRHVQRDVLDREPARTGVRRLAMPADDSIAVVGAPSPRRELESVAAEIWAQIRHDARDDARHDARDDARHDARDDARHDEGRAGQRHDDGPPPRVPLRFSDIAVLIAGPAEPYLALAPSVFREAGDLPHTLIDPPLATASRVVEAVLALLALPSGELSRREVLDVVTHPNVRATCPDADPAFWLDLVEALAIARGADRQALADTYIEGDRFNWDQGLRRLVLGTLARGPRSGLEDALPLGDGDSDGNNTGHPTGYIPAELSPDLEGEAAALALLVRSLLADARFARDARLPLADWMRFVRALLAAYVVPLSPADEAARLRVLAALEGVASAASPDLVVGLGTARELVREALGGLGAPRGQLLGAGVAVGTLHALRSIPFRTVFVVGLGADRFPAAARALALDPGTSRRRAGDMTPTDRDRYGFLEALLAARERLVLSHVDRDPLTGAPRQPASVVAELLGALADGYLAAPAEALMRRVPLLRDEAPAVCAAFPAAAAEARARALGDALRADVPGAARLDTTALLRGLGRPARTQLGALLHTIEAPAADGAGPRPRGDARRVRLDLRDFRRFLECPLQGGARVRMGLRELEDDTEAREVTDEPFEVPASIRRGLLTDAYASAWRGVGPPTPEAQAQAYLVEARRQRHASRLPVGPFAQAATDAHLRFLRLWTAALSAGEPTFAGPSRRVRFGRGDATAAVAASVETRAPLELTVEVNGTPIVVEVHGVTEPLLQVGDAGLASLVLGTSTRPSDERDSLRLFIDHVALAAGATTDAGETIRHIGGFICRPKTNNDEEAALRTFAWRPLDATAARRFLADLAGELLGATHAYLLPCEAVILGRGGDLSIAEWIEKIRTDDYYRKVSSSRWGPVPEPFSFPAPSPADADAIAARRFGPYFDSREEVGGPTPVRKTRPR